MLLVGVGLVHDGSLGRVVRFMLRIGSFISLHRTTFSVEALLYLLLPFVAFPALCMYICKPSFHSNIFDKR